MRSAGQSISDPVVCTLFVHDSVLEAQELGENPLLPESVQTLVRQVNQAALICENGELGVLQVRTPLLYCQQNRQILFFVG